MDIKVVLFDLGGVVVELKGFSTIMSWIHGVKNEEELANSWYSSSFMDAYHKGKISTDEFIKSMMKEFNMSVSEAVFIEEYACFPKSLYPGVIETLKKLKEKYTVACFSTTNELHWDMMTKEMQIDKLFEYNFLSNVIGMVKPHRDSFEYVVRQLGCKPHEIVFFDDTQVNIDTAREIGINAFKVKGFGEVQEKLMELKLL